MAAVRSSMWYLAQFWRKNVMAHLGDRSKRFAGHRIPRPPLRGNSGFQSDLHVERRDAGGAGFWRSRL